MLELESKITALTMATTIDPTTDPSVQSQIEAAFKTAPDNLTYKLKDADQKVVEAFGLKTPAYFELQAYLHLGIGTLSGTDAWHSFVSQDAQDELGNIDVKVFPETVQAFTDVHNNCVNFDTKTMGKFLTVTSSIISYCQDAIKYISGKNLLKDQFKIILQVQPVGSTEDQLAALASSQKLAAKVIKSICILLARRAQARAAECSDLVLDINGFMTLTKKDRSQIWQLEHKYIGKQDGSDGKFYVIDDGGNFVKKDDKNVVNYLTQIRGKSDEYAHLAIQERKKAAEDWDKWRDLTIVASTAVTYLAIPVIGWFAAPAVAIGAGVAADLAKKDMEEQEKNAKTHEKKVADLNLVTDTVTKLISQMTLTEKAMEGAITALEQLETSFNQQASQLKSIAANVETLEGYADPDEAVDFLIDQALNDALDAWAKVKYLAEDFVKHFGIEFSEVVKL